MTLQKRPKLAIPRTTIEWVLDILAVLFFVGCITYMLSVWSSLPERIPVHFNLHGEADRWGNKGMVWMLVLIGAVSWIGMTVMEKFPHTYNYFNLTETNVERQYKNARIMINVMKNEMLIFLAYLGVLSVQMALNGGSNIGVWNVIIFLAIFLGTLAFFIIRAIRLK